MSNITDFPTPSAPPDPGAAPAATTFVGPQPLLRLALIPLFALMAGGLALGLLYSLAPEPLRPPDPVRAVEVLATYAHKRAVTLSLLIVPIAALLAAGCAPWVAAAGRAPSTPMTGAAAGAAVPPPRCRGRGARWAGRRQRRWSPD